MFVKLFDAPFTNLYSPYVFRWWELFSPIVAYQAKGVESLAVSYSNLVNPGTYDAVLGVAPTWNATDGWVFNVSTQYLTIDNVTINQDFTAIIRLSGISATETAQLFGLYLVDNNFLFSFGKDEGDNFYQLRFNGKTTTEYATIPASVVIAINKAGVYFDGTLVKAGAAPDNFSTTSKFGIGAVWNHVGDTAVNFIECNVQAFAMYDKTLSANEILAVTQAMEAI